MESGLQTVEPRHNNADDAMQATNEYLTIPNNPKLKDKDTDAAAMQATPAPSDMSVAQHSHELHANDADDAMQADQDTPATADFGSSDTSSPIHIGSPDKDEMMENEPNPGSKDVVFKDPLCEYKTIPARKRAADDDEDLESNTRRSNKKVSVAVFQQWQAAKWLTFRSNSARSRRQRRRKHAFPS